MIGSTLPVTMKLPNLIFKNMRLVLKDIESKPMVLSFLLVVLGNMMVFPTIHPAWAEWTVQGEGNLFGTEDVALFSATRRLTKDQDPTQPVIDSELAEQGSDAVLEPVLQIKKSLLLFGRDSELKVRGQGYSFLRVDYVFLRDQSEKRWVTLDAKPIFDRPFKTLDGYQWASNHIGYSSRRISFYINEARNGIGNEGRGRDSSN